jgi:cell wall-associated NlpC family hydrolase
VEALAGGQGVLLGEIVDLDVAKLPLDAPPADEGDDSAAHAQTNGAVDELQALEDEAAEQAALDPPEDIKALRLRVVRAAMLGYKHKDEVHYTTGPRRWDGITNRCRSHLGRYPKWADCSSYVTWCLWDALGGTNAGPDIVNGQSWRGGYTGTLRDHGRRVSLETAMPGDLVHYGVGTGSHVAIVVGKDKAISHGSEDGPFLVKPDYRDDLAEVRRYVA